MISLVTNTPQYNNDISEEIRLFLGLVDISFSDNTQAEMTCKVTLGESTALCELFPQKVSALVPFTPSADRLEKKRREKRAVKLATFEAMRKVFPAHTPWGSLTGIRPTKLYRESVYRTSEKEADEQFSNVFSVSSEKLGLVKTIHRIQNPIISSAGSDAFDVYLGIPYCKTRCIYCSFGSELYKNDGQLQDYLDHLKKEISGSAALMKELGFSIRCAYFGGGTPTVLSAEKMDELLGFTEDSYQGLGCEFTVEAGRPDTITKDKLEVLKKHGVSRISINPQTMNETTLRIIGRSHSPEDIVRCFSMAKDMGFDNINMDVIAGLPGEDSFAFAETLEAICKLNPESLTVHTLALKKSSPLIDKLDQFPLPSAEETDKMVKLGAEAARELGMAPYYMYRQKYMSGNLENVGYAKAAKECIYNVDMMEETVSVMAHGAHTISKRVFPSENRVERVANPKDIQTYFDKIPELINMKRKAFSLTT